MAFNEPNTVRRHLGLDSGNNYLTDEEINTFLDEANDDLFVKIKKEYERENYTVGLDSKGSIQREYGFSLSPVVSIYKVFVNGVLQTVTTHYTFDSDKHTVTFVDSVLESGDKLEILYIPKIYFLAELYLALYNISLRTSVLGGGDINPLAEAFSQKKDMYFKTIKNRVVLTGWY